MAQEIELKFIVVQNGVEMLREQLNTLETKHTSTDQLLNIYYKIADSQLRRHGIGLCICGDQGRYEMTLKIAGRVVGGLRQRPEYNIPLGKPGLALERLSAEVWPQSELPVALAEHVQPLFSTDFAHERWVIQEENSETEIILDHGEAKAGEHQELTCELELELPAGETADLLCLAHRLLESGVLHQGSLSKVACGYHLAQDNGEHPVTSLTVLTVATKTNMEQEPEVALENILAHRSYHDEVRLRGNTKTKAEILPALTRVRHILMLLGGIMPRKATTQLRTLLDDAETVLLAADTADEVLLRTEVIGTRLALAEWLVQRGWHPFLNEVEERRMAGSFKRFAGISLSRVAAELHSAMQHLAVEDAVDQLLRLSRDIDSVQLLADAYGNAVALWLENWQELHRTAVHDNRSIFEYFRRQVLAAELFWLHNGKR